MRISDFVIGFLVVALFTVVVTFFIIGVDNNYTSVEIDESSLSAYDKVSELNALAADMNESLTNIQQGNVVDVVGGMLTSGFTVLKTTETSFELYTDVSSEAIDNSNLGESTGTWKVVALTLGILLFIFAMVGVLTGRRV